jgi:hypothetical protein
MAGAGAGLGALSRGVRLGLFAMTNEELVAKARELIKQLEWGKDGLPVRLDALPNVRVQDAVVVWFEGEQKDVKLKVVLDRESGKPIIANLTDRPPLNL